MHPVLISSRRRASASSWCPTSGPPTPRPCRGSTTWRPHRRTGRPWPRRDPWRRPRAADLAGFSLRAALVCAVFAEAGPAADSRAQLLTLGEGHHLVAAELAAQRGDGLQRGRALLAGGEPGEQRRRDHRHRHREGDRLLDGPPALAGVDGVVGHVVERRVLLERLDHEVEQPGPHDRPPAPRLERAGHVLDDVLLLEQLVALGVGLHQAVLDAVVHHLRVVPGADLAGVHEPLVARTLGAQRVEDRHRLLHVRGRAADHQAVAVVEAPDAAGDTAVEVADALGLEQLLVLEVVGEAAVATVDDQVALVEQAGELGDGVAGRRTAGHHDPHHPRRVEPLDEVGQRARVRHGLVAVVPHDLVASAADALAHVAAHLAQPDQTQLHLGTPRCVWCVGDEVLIREGYCDGILKWLVRMRTAPASARSGTRCRPRRPPRPGPRAPPGATPG